MPVQHLYVQVEADVSFSWHWEKLGMSGTGVGELLLKGGRIEYTFTVVNEVGVS